MTHLRLFLALELPEEKRAEIHEAAERLRAALARRSPDARVAWVPAANLHFTLKFLGSVPEGRLSEIRAAAAPATLACGRLRYRIRGVGAFPPSGRASVLWVGAEDIEGRMALLAARLDAAFEPLGFAAEKRVFVPHLTIGRVKSGHVEPAALDAVADADLGEATALDVALMRSHAMSQGSVYERLSSFPLA